MTTGMNGPTPAILGRNHGFEPDDVEDMVAGNTWELDEEAEDTTSIDDFLLTLDTIGIDTKDLRNEWQERGKPTSYEGGGLDLIERAVARAIRAGYDVYDSDTRTYVFEERKVCHDCEDGDDSECRAMTAIMLRNIDHHGTNYTEDCCKAQPDSDKPSTRRLLMADKQSASLELYLVDATTDDTQAHILRVENWPGDQHASGLVAEWVDIARAILKYAGVNA